ncbi:MAG: ABC transporter permease [Bacteroidales bacterium]
MFRSFILVALRYIRRDVTYSLINIIGLTIGITGSLILILYVFDDLSYDRYHEKSDRIFRISSRITEPDDAFNWAVTPVPLAPQLMTDYPEVEEATRFIPAQRHLYQYGDNKFFEEDVSYADSNLFNVFDYEWIEGDPESALKEPRSIVLTRSFSDRYFGSESPMGKELKREDDRSFNVTGLIEDLPHNTNYKFNALISRNTLPEYRASWSWAAFYIYTYVLLQAGFDHEVFKAKLPELYTNHMADILDRYGWNVILDVLPITWIHLHSDFQGEPVPVGNISYVRFFFAIIALMLLIASMNYMNLATARSTKRSKEIGIRKVAGSSRRSLIRQFLVESFIFTLLALLISIIFVSLLLPAFNNIAGKSIGPEYLFTPLILISLLVVVLVTGLLAGSYPAFFLSSFNPVKVLKGQLSFGGSNLNIRKVLVVVQFTLSTILVISTWIIYDQINYLKNKDLGFDKENVITLSLTTQEMRDKLPVLKQNLKASPNILHVGVASATIGRGTMKHVLRVETPEGMVTRGINNFHVDHDFIDAVGIKLIEGRGFSEEFPGDTATGVIINQTLAERLNWDNPIGKKVDASGDSSTISTVVGLIADYHQSGLYNVMEDLMLFYHPKYCYSVFVKVSGREMSSTIDYIKEQWTAQYPDFPFDYSFLDEDFSEQFEADEKRGTVYTFFSILTIVIACLGLFGLTSFTSEMRTREIGLRKVHGANVPGIVRLMLREYLQLILVAILIASAVSLYLANRWLESLVYRTEINWISFVLAGLIMLAITAATVSYHTIRSANVNPAESLRYE